MTSLTLVRRIRARPAIVFDALTTPEGIACWWGPDDGPVLLAETDPRVGGRYRVRFRMLDGSEHGLRTIDLAAPWRRVPICAAWPTCCAASRPENRGRPI